MDHTFTSVFQSGIMVDGLWHEANGEIRYEAIMEEEKDGTQISYLFPIFNPESKEFDDYKG
jgi:hypothetical protein